MTLISYISLACVFINSFSLIYLTRQKREKEFLFTSLLVSILIASISIFLRELSINLHFYFNLLFIVFAGALLYIFLKKQRAKGSRYLFNLVLPSLLLIIIVANTLIDLNTKIEISIIGNLMVAIVNLVYSVLCLILMSSIRFNDNTSRTSMFILFTSSFIILIILYSIVTLVSSLYFTDNIRLVNLSVNVPKLFQSKIQIWLLTATSIFGCLFAFRTKYGKKEPNNL